MSQLESNTTALSEVLDLLGSKASGGGNVSVNVDVGTADFAVSYFDETGNLQVTYGNETISPLNGVLWFVAENLYSDVDVVGNAFWIVEPVYAAYFGVCMFVSDGAFSVYGGGAD